MRVFFAAALLVVVRLAFPDLNARGQTVAANSPSVPAVPPNTNAPDANPSAIAASNALCAANSAVTNAALAAAMAANAATNAVQAAVTAKNAATEARSAKGKEPPFLVQTAVTILVTIATALITGWFKDRGRMKAQIKSEFREAIKDLRAFSEDISQQVVNHLTATPFANSKQKQSQAVILSQLKLCGGRLQRATKLLDKAHRGAVEAEFLTWKSELTGGRFPVHKRENACEPHDPYVTQVHAAREKWTGYLDDLTRNCMNGALKVPLKPKS